MSQNGTQKSKLDLKTLILIPLGVTIIGGAVLLFLEYRSGVFVTRENAPTPSMSAPMTQVDERVSVDDGLLSTEIVEGDIKEFIFGNDVLTIGSEKWKGNPALDYYGDDVKLTIVTQNDRRYETLRPGDCVVVRPFRVDIVDVDPEGPQTASVIITKLASDANVESCQIRPTKEP